MLHAALASAGRQAVLTREPGGTRGAEFLRAALLSGEHGWSLPAEMLLHFAARADHVEQLIRPALARGAWVVCDRFYDSTMAYQGFGQGGDRAAITALSAMLGLAPDVTIMLDVPLAVSLSRVAQRPGQADRYERLGAAFFARVAAGFAAIAESDPGRCLRIDATADVDAVHRAVWQAVRLRLAA
jgi:dTMP kinase